MVGNGDNGMEVRVPPDESEDGVISASFKTMISTGRGRYCLDFMTSPCAKLDVGVICLLK